MKKLLTTLFAVFVVVSAFATVNVETITPNVYYQGACERVGTMKFIVANDQDYQSVDSANYVIIKVQLTSGAVLCKNLFEATDSDGNTYPVWGDLEVDGTFWQAGDVQGYGAAGDNIIYIKICAAPNNAGAVPSSTAQAWFIIGNTEAVGNTGVVFTPNAICVDFSSSSLALNEFFYVSITDYLVTQATTGIYCADAAPTVTGSLLGTSYSPANPAIAYGSTENAHNLVVEYTCGKYATGISNDDVYLCQCYTSESTTVDQQTVTTYECFDIYRVGTLNFLGGDCEIYLTEDSVGMLPENSVIELSVVDAAGNPIEVYFANVPTLSTDVTSGLALSAGTPVGLVDGAGVDTASNVSYAGYSNGSTDCAVSYVGYDYCTDNYDLYSTIQYTVTAASVNAPGEIHIGSIDLGRLASAGAVDAYIKVSWYPVPCGTGNSVVIDNPLHFVDCPPEPVEPVNYYQTALYFPYFPATTSWWSGLAVTNVNYFYNVVAGLNSYFVGTATNYYTNQDIDVTLYLIEADGDIYVYDAGTLPASGISTFLLSDPAFAPVLMDGYTDDAFGDERFWVIAVGTATVGNTAIAMDGFGMLGDGTQAQGFLPRIPSYFDASAGLEIGLINNK